jgi:hypothetical protein
MISLYMLRDKKTGFIANGYPHGWLSFIYTNSLMLQFKAAYAVNKGNLSWRWRVAKESFIDVTQPTHEQIKIWQTPRDVYLYQRRIATRLVTTLTYNHDKVGMNNIIIPSDLWTVLFKDIIGNTEVISVEPDMSMAVPMDYKSVMPKSVRKELGMK